MIEIFIVAGYIGYMMDFISDFTWWETIAKLAPIGTALIALAAAIIAWCAILAHRDIARRRAAIDFFFKTEIDEKALALYNKFKAYAPSMTSVPPTTANRDVYNDIRAWLNICELIAVGIAGGAFSESVSKAYWGDVIPNSYPSRSAKSRKNSRRRRDE
jgi:Domain of unknown function (DUF4760)